MRIALLDDAAVSRALFMRIATELGHEVVIVPVPTDRDEAIDVAAVSDAVRGIDPEIVIVDGRLADRLGTRADAATRLANVVTLLRAAVPPAAVAVVAALGETALVRAAADAGAGFVVPRPYLRSQLAATLAVIASERGTVSR